MKNKNNTKSKKTKLILTIIIFIIIILTYFFMKRDSNYFKEDLIFFKNYYFREINEKQNYETNSDTLGKLIKVSKNDSNTRQMSLFSNIANELKWDKLIYPGTKGEIPIQLYGQENLKYKVKFQSKNEKPKNLMFKEKGREEEYETLEELGETLKGNLAKGEKKAIFIEWEWKYETNEKDNIQDTLDGKKIQEYNFDIIVRGEEI